MKKETRFLVNPNTIQGLVNKYKCYSEDYYLLKKHNYIIDETYLYVVVCNYLKEGRIIRNYSFINVFNSLDDFLSLDLSMIGSKEVYFLSLKEYKDLPLEYIVHDIKSNHIADNFCIDKIPQSL